MKTKEELKTLKDLDKNWIKGDGRLESEIRWYKSQIRAEAVKWVKELIGQDIQEDNSKNEVSVAHFIDFFNLTKEDLE
jgi:hypothetical protein